MGRAPCCEKTGLKRGKWTVEEDEKLVSYITANGEGSWRSLPRNAGLLRCGKSCRLRWVNYLRADVKRGNFTADEEETIVKLHINLGNRWSLIASHLSGRTDNEIKNYWNSHLSRRMYSFRSIANAQPTLSTPHIIKKPARRTSKKCNKKEHGPDDLEPGPSGPLNSVEGPARTTSLTKSSSVTSCDELSSLQSHTDGGGGWPDAFMLMSPKYGSDVEISGPWGEVDEEAFMMGFRNLLEESDVSGQCGKNIPTNDAVRESNTDGGTTASDERGWDHLYASPIFADDEEFRWDHDKGAAEEASLWVGDEGIWIWS